MGIIFDFSHTQFFTMQDVVVRSLSAQWEMSLSVCTATLLPWSHFPYAEAHFHRWADCVLYHQLPFAQWCKCSPISHSLWRTSSFLLNTEKAIVTAAVISESYCRVFVHNTEGMTLYRCWKPKVVSTAIRFTWCKPGILTRFDLSLPFDEDFSL